MDEVKTSFLSATTMESLSYMAHLRLGGYSYSPNALAPNPTYLNFVAWC